MLRITMTVDVDADMLCDMETLQADFGGDWLRFVNWLADEERGPHFYAVNWPDTMTITNAELVC